MVGDLEQQKTGHWVQVRGGVQGDGDSTSRNPHVGPGGPVLRRPFRQPRRAGRCLSLTAWTGDNDSGVSVRRHGLRGRGNEPIYTDAWRAPGHTKVQRPRGWPRPPGKQVSRVSPSSAARSRATRSQAKANLLIQHTRRFTYPRAGPNANAPSGLSTSLYVSRHARSHIQTRPRRRPRPGGFRPAAPGTTGHWGGAKRGRGFLYWPYPVPRIFERAGGQPEFRAHAPRQGSVVSLANMLTRWVPLLLLPARGRPAPPQHKVATPPGGRGRARQHMQDAAVRAARWAARIEPCTRARRASVPQHFLRGGRAGEGEERGMFLHTRRV